MTAAAVTPRLQPRSSHRRTLCHYSFINSRVPVTTVVQLRRRRTNNSLVYHEVKFRLELNRINPNIIYDIMMDDWGCDFVQKSRNSIHEARAWAIPRSGMMVGDYGDDIDEDDDDDEEDEEEDRSLDLLIRFVENVFRKVSRKARKAVKSVLPVPISTRLVGFAVNGTIILTFLWVLKAFLEVICNLGSVVFASILVIRGIWTGICYFQEIRGYRVDDDYEQPQTWSRSQPAT